MSTFPYTGKQTLSGASDSNVSTLQTVVNQIQDTLLGMVQGDPAVKIISHFDNSLASHLGLAGVGSGPIRYWAGKFGAAGVLVEQANSNLLGNPSAEVDLTSWSASDGSVNLTRDSSTAYTANNTTSAASFKLAGTGNAGLSYAKAATVPVTPGTFYSASAYVYSATAAKVKLELAFTGGTPSTVTSSTTTLSANTWTRIRFENQSSGTGNTSCEVRVYLAQQAPTYSAPSQLSTISPTATAAVTDGAMTISTGDICMAAMTSNPSGPLAYSWHMVTTGATGVSGAALRLDDSNAAPTFVGGTQFSKMAPAFGTDTVAVTDNVTNLNAGDFVFCNLVGVGYGWHMVTTGGTASGAALRLDDSPAAPSYVVGSRLTRIAANNTAAVTDNAMTITAGDMVYCRTLSNPTSSAYGWHMVTTGATGVNNVTLRLDNAPSNPNYATGSRFSRKAVSATGNNTDNAATLTTGDFAFAYPTKNPAGTGYGWHMISTGATGVATSTLRIDAATSDVVNADCIQLEANSVATGFTDSYQGTGFSGALGASTSRAATTLTYPTSGNITAGAGSVAFWFYPEWAGNDNLEHVLFDIAIGPEQDRIRFFKDNANLLNLSIYDTNGQLKQWTTPAVNFARETWQHVAFTYSGGNVFIALNGTLQSLGTTGSGTGQITNLATNMYLGTDFSGNVYAGSVFDDLVVANAALTTDQLRNVGTDTGPYLGLAPARKGIDTALGNANTDASAGTQSQVSHGLGVTPSFVEITSRNNGVVYLSQTSDANNFYVKGSANSVNYDWRAFA